MSNLSLRERDAATIAQIGKLRFSPLSVVGGQGNRLNGRRCSDVLRAQRPQGNRIAMFGKRGDAVLPFGARRARHQIG